MSSFEKVKWREGFEQYRAQSEKQSNLYVCADLLNYERKRIIHFVGIKPTFPMLKEKWFFINCTYKELILPCTAITPKKVFMYADNFVSDSDLKNAIDYLKKSYKTVIISPLREKKSVGGSYYTTVCVAVDISNGYDSWYKSLSKNYRQNVRTQKNRIEKEGHKIQFIHTNGKFSCALWVKKSYIHRKRNLQRRGIRITLPIKLLCGVAAIIDCFKPFSRTLRVADNAYSCFCLIDNKLAAYSNGFFDGNRYVVSELSYDSKFKRFGPGGLLIDESIKYLTEKQLASIYDLYIGDEPYKFSNGGKSYDLYNYIA